MDGRLWKRCVCLVAGHRFRYVNVPAGWMHLLVGVKEMSWVLEFRCERCGLERST